MTYGSESECATHYTTAPHISTLIHFCTKLLLVSTEKLNQLCSNSVATEIVISVCIQSYNFGKNLDEIHVYLIGGVVADLYKCSKFLLMC